MTMSLKGQKSTQQRHRKEETTLKGKKKPKQTQDVKAGKEKKKKRCFFRFSLEMSKENRRGETREEKEIMNTDAEKERIFAVLKQSSKTSK